MKFLNNLFHNSKISFKIIHLKKILKFLDILHLKCILAWYKLILKASVKCGDKTCYRGYFRVHSHLGMFVTTGCSSRRQFVATASRQDTSSRQQNTDSGRQVTASGQFYKPSQTQESKYGNYALLLLRRLKWKKWIYLQ